MSLLQEEVLSLGHILSDKKIHPNPSLVRDVQLWEPPNNLKDLQAFLKLCNYYHTFVPAFAELASPFHSLLKEGATFMWTDENQDTFTRSSWASTSSTLMPWTYARCLEHTPADISHRLSRGTVIRSSHGSYLLSSTTLVNSTTKVSWLTGWKSSANMTSTLTTKQAVSWSCPLHLPHIERIWDTTYYRSGDAWEPCSEEVLSLLASGRAATRSSLLLLGRSKSPTLNLAGSGSRFHAKRGPADLPWSPSPWSSWGCRSYHWYEIGDVHLL